MKISTFAGLMSATMVAVLLGCSKSGDPAAPPADSAPAPAPVQAPAPEPVEVAPLAPELLARLVRPNSPILGRADAPVTIVEFLDPACEACRAFAPVVKQILFLYGNDVRVVVRYAAFHQGSDEAVRALEGSRKQGRFEPVLTALFDRQEEWASHGAPKPENVWKIAAENGVDITRARRDGASAAADALLRQEEEDQVAIQVHQTPTFFVNGKPLPTFGAQALIDLVTREVQAAREAAQPAP